MSNVAQRSFSGGEISPSLYARTDTQKYHTALRTLRNMLALKHGGATNRPGTEYLGQGDRWLLPFVFNDAQSYILGFKELSLTIIQAGAYIGVTVVTPYTAAELPALQITQSADVLTIVHPSHPVMQLKRLGALSWTLTPVVFGPSIQPPGSIVIAPPSGGTSFRSWVVTAISESTGAESLPSSIVGFTSVDLPAARTITWATVPGAASYNVYEAWYGSGGYGFVTNTVSTSYRVLDQSAPDFLDQPPAPRPLFAAVGDYPAAVGQYQQRRWLAGTNASPETVWSSRTSDLDNFCVSVPVQDDDAVTFTLRAKTVNAIRHLVDSTTLFLFTSGSEAIVRGDASGTVRPTDINLLTFSRHGSGALAPIVTEDAIVFLQARGSIIREIVEADVREKYEGRDLTIYATHLFLGHRIVSWAWQGVPNSTLWCVRDDGVLLGLTYMNDQQVLAWHRHDTDGLVECVCVIPEGGEDALYLIVNRGGVRMTERMTTRNWTDVKDAIFMDSTLSYDGRNTGAETMTLSGGSTWESDELLTVTRSFASGFTIDEIGNEVHFTALDGALRFRITEWVSPTVVRGFAHRTVPADLRTVATRVWSRAVDTFAGLNHLEAKSLAVTGDGYVIASPNNPAYAERPCIVTGGEITFSRCYAYLHAGLPYISDLETLDLDSSSGPSLKDGKMKVNDVTAYVEQSRGYFGGQRLPSGADPVELMDEAKFRDVSADFGLIELRTEAMGVKIPAGWNDNGRVALRNVDPIPLTVLAIIPRGHLSPAG